MKIRNQNNNVGVFKKINSVFYKSSGERKPFLFVVVTLLFATVGASLFISSMAAGETLYLTPSTSNISLGSNFTVTVRENSNTTPVNAVQADLTYDATKLQFVSISTTTSAFDLGLAPTGGGGNVNIVRTKTGASLTGDQIVATVTFRAIGTGATPVSFTNVSEVLRTTDQANILEITTPATYTVSDTTAPSVPTGLIAGTRTVNSIAFSWTASTDNNAVTGYRVYRNGTLVNGNVSATTFTDTGRTPNTSYSYTVNAFDAAANTSAVSSALAISTLPDTIAPSVPTGLIAGTRTVNSIAFSWTASTDNVAVTGYRVYRAGAQIGTTASTTYSQTGLTAGTSYSYTVAAYDAVGNTSAQSSALATSTLADTIAPSAPQGLSSPTQTTNSISLAWNASTDNIGVVGYNIQRNGTPIGTSATASYTNTGLTQGAQFTYTVTAYDAAGNTSTVSNSLITTTIVKAGDINGDSLVSLPDFTILAANWNRTGMTRSQGDLNGDGVINLPDFSILAANWGT